MGRCGAVQDCYRRLSSELIFLICFIGLVIAMLAIDLGVVNRKSHVVSLREALVWTGVWVGVAMLFYLFLLFRPQPGQVEMLL